MPSGSTIVATTAVAVTTMQVALVNIRWVSKTAAAGDECKVTDADGNVIFDSFATGANWEDSQRHEKIPLVKGLTVAVITSGTVYFDVA